MESLRTEDHIDFNTYPRTHIALDVDAVSAGYPGDRFAIENMTFSVQAGERVAIIGPNGAGKSTLFKAIVGLVPFTRGHISIHGEDCRTSHNMVGYVPQHGEIDWSFPVTVRDVVMMGRTRQIGWVLPPLPRDHRAVTDLLEKLSLSSVANRQIGELSGGQRRRVFIARALAQETDVLLMDEPFTGVDTTAEQEIMRTLDILTESGITILLATHDLSRAAESFDKMLLVNRQAIAYGTPRQVMTPDALSRAYANAIQVYENDGKTFMIADEHGCGD